MFDSREGLTSSFLSRRSPAQVSKSPCDSDDSRHLFLSCSSSCRPSRRSAAIDTRTLSISSASAATGLEIEGRLLGALRDSTITCARATYWRGISSEAAATSKTTMASVEKKAQRLPPTTEKNLLRDM